MSHDINASWAAAEIATMFSQTPQLFSNGVGHSITAYAGKESNSVWPLADGVISIEVDGNIAHSVALEFKRENEGLHGILTALGQAYSYLNKGYNGSIIVIPDHYSSHSSPGNHLNNIIELTGANLPIGIFTYEEPDTTQTSPFRNKITTIRPLDLVNNSIGNHRVSIQQGTTTQWAHLRDGSSDPSAFYEYLKIANQLNINNASNPDIGYLPQPLVDSVTRIAPDVDPVVYLSNAPRGSFMDYVWRNFWFGFILNEQTAAIWNEPVNGIYEVNNHVSGIKLPDDSGYKVFFANRSDSIKNIIVADLNGALITEEIAWERYAENLHDRAHSYREDIDSGLEHIGLMDDTGKPSEVGYKFLTACERNGENPNIGTPKMVLGAAILKNGDLISLLHYIFRLTRERLKLNPMDFTFGKIQNGLINYLSSVPNSLHRGELRGGQRKYSFTDNYCSHTFNKHDYLIWLANELANNFHVMSTSSARGGATRPPLQGEITVLRQYGIVGEYRVGVGLDINWPLIESYLNVEI